MRLSIKTFLCFAAPLGVALASAGPARATGYETARFGADHGHPALSNPYAVYFNPAALGGMTGTVLQGDVNLAVRSIDYTRDPASLTPSDDRLRREPNYVSANTGEAKLLNVLASPFVGMATDLGTKSLRLGLASYVPFGGQSSWNQNNTFDNSRAAPAVDGPQRWQDITSRLTSIYNTAAFAYRFEGPRLTIGVGASLVLNSVKALRARNLDGSDDVQDTGGALKEGRALLDVSSATFGASAGIFWEATADRKLRIGLSYTSQPGFGENRLKGTLEQQFGSASQVAQATKVDFLQTFPDIVRLGAAWRLSDEIEARADFTYERWSVMKQQCVVEPGASCQVDSVGNDLSGNHIILNLPRRWKDTFTGRLGGAYFAGDSEIFGSVGAATSAVPNNTLDASTFDANNLFFTLGVRHEFNRTFAAAASYNQVYYFPVDTIGKSQIATFVPPSRSPNADGHWEAAIYFLNANVSVKF